jgi:hypothetical protein
VPFLIHCILVEHHDLPVAQEEDIFKRIQQGMTLVTGGQDGVGISCHLYLTSLPEKSSVGNTPRKAFIKDLAADYMSLGKQIPQLCDIDM